MPPVADVRLYRDADYARVVALFDDAYAGMGTTYGTVDELAALRRACQGGQVVAECGGVVVGVILSLPCRYDAFCVPQSMDAIYDPARFEEHGRDADSLFALEILVHSAHHRRGIGKQMNAAIASYLRAAGLRAFLGVSRVTGYAAVRDIVPIEEYLQRVRAGELHDPSLSFNCANGMLPTVPVPSYFPADVASAGFGALVVQPNPGWRPDPVERLLVGEPGYAGLPPLLPAAQAAALSAKLGGLPPTFVHPGMPDTWGRAFENFSSFDDYLRPSAGEGEVDRLCAPLLAGVVGLFTGRGYTVAPLLAADGRAFAVGDVRAVDVLPGATSLHVDDLRLDGSVLPDFELPPALYGAPLVQLSVVCWLEAAGDAALRMYGHRYTSADDAHRLPNGWQFADAAVEGCGVVDLLPRAGTTIVMASQHLHDVRGGERTDRWVYYSVYVLVVPGRREAWLYV